MPKFILNQYPLIPIIHHHDIQLAALYIDGDGGGGDGAWCGLLASSSWPHHKQRNYTTPRSGGGNTWVVG